MSISYQPKDASVQSVQLKVQELCLTAADAQIVSLDGSDTIIDLKETISSSGGVKVALKCDDSAGTVTKIEAADIEYPESVDENGDPAPTVPGGKKIKLLAYDLTADANDVLILKYAV